MRYAGVWNVAARSDATTGCGASWGNGAWKVQSAPAADQEKHTKGPDPFIPFILHVTLFGARICIRLVRKANFCV